MSNAIIESTWPARGGFVSNGSFENTTYNEDWTISSGCTIKKNTTYYVHGSNSAETYRSTGSGSLYVDQTIANPSYFAGKRCTLLGRARTTGEGKTGNIILNYGTSLSEWSNRTAGGTGNFEYLRASVLLPDTIAWLKVRLRFGVPNIGPIIYWDAISLVLGDTYGRVEIDESHIFPIGKPESVPSGSVILADGEIAGVEDNIVVIDRRFRYEAIEETLYLKLRNFYRYVACGMSYEFTYTDTDGVAYAARMMSDCFSDTEEIGPGLYNTTLSLRLTDRGII